ncbi:MAG: 50S ribosomal protein L25/general stress protein Ctc [Candidatus Zixiibacteriota bacterium]|nr:MAG: 50S ribosomal protein L25/general stress protein Ctc [candidate division Zixibacteria bacterium]
MKELSLAAQPRTEAGKGAARRARMEGFIPGVVYGPEIEPLSIAVKEKDFRAAMRGSVGTAIINLDVGGKANKVILRDIQRDPITSRVMHVDFHAVSMNKEINVSVPVNFVGTPRGVKTDGGIMQITMHELEISCLPANIPDQLDINVEDLGIGESIHVRDVTMPNTRILSQQQRTIVVIAAPTVIKAEEVAEEEAVEGEPVEGEEGVEAPEEAEGAEGAKEAEGEAPKEDGKKKG